MGASSERAEKRRRMQPQIEDLSFDGGRQTVNRVARPIGRLLTLNAAFYD